MVQYDIAQEVFAYVYGTFPNYGLWLIGGS